MTIPDIFHFLLSFDQHLQDFVVQHGKWAYFLLGAIVFGETGLVVLPFLPGDSLLFATGALCARGLLRWDILVLVLFAAAFCGDNLNYVIGRTLGPRVLKGETGRWLNRKNLDRTHAFFEKHGGKAVTMARFIPIIRTFSPFVAGVGSMRYMRFAAYSLLGTALWAAVCVTAGYVFGNVPFVRHNFSVVVLGIVVVSLIPFVVHVVSAQRAAKREAAVKLEAATEVERTAA